MLYNCSAATSYGMKIIFDFDYTLLDTNKLREAIIEVFSRHGVSRDEFSKTLEESRVGGRDWKPTRQFEILKENSVYKVGVIKKEFETLLQSTDKFLYKDVAPFIEEMRNHNFSLVTYGEDSFQRMKTDGCSLFKKHFDKIVITQNLYKDKEVAELSAAEPAIFVEDNPTALEATKKHAPHIKTVRINRGGGRYSQDPSGDGVDHEIKNLSEIKMIINESS